MTLLRSVLLGVIATLAVASSASASTLTMTGGTLAYTAGAGTVSAVSFTQSASPTDTVTVTRDTGSGDNDPITAAPGTCTTSDGGVIYACTGVTAVTADGADGNDTFDAGALNTIPATLTGGDGTDSLAGGGANDTLSGGAGDDTITGGAGNDAISGGDGADQLSGGTGTDTVDGGNGDDFLFEAYNTITNPSGAGAPADTGDTLTGGDGFDTLDVGATNTDQKGTVSTADDTTTPLPTSVTLDDLANDGASGQNANVRSDIEVVYATSGAANTLTGNAGSNQLNGSTGNDTIDGGAGNDVLRGGGGDDTINADDGYADFVTCGDGADTANVDGFDTVSSDCETVHRSTTTQNATEDKAPTITLTAPAAASTLSTKKATTITATASDDKGVSAVLFTVNGRLVCTDTTAPYSCDYQPQGSDVGRDAIVAAAVDTSQQTAFAQRTITVPRFDPHRFTAYVTPGRDLFGVRRFTAKGRLSLPAPVAPADGCGHGTVTVQIKAGFRTISTRRVGLRKDCTYRSTVTFTNAKRFVGEFSLRYAIVFGGNAALRHTKVHRYSVRVA